MARRYNKRNPMEGEEKPTSGPVSLAGLIRFQPNRKKANKGPWRPLQLSDFGDDENNNDAEESDPDAAPSRADNYSGPGVTRERASHMHLAPLQTNLHMSPVPVSQGPVLQSKMQSPKDVSSASIRSNSEDISPTDTRFGVVVNYARIFGGPLPDPIYLQEEIGEVDRQVIFIAHPNRDVSAHQWSLDSFQWVNIGLYSLNRRRIEGSLASDRLRGSTIAQNSIEYFKAVAEQRQEQPRPVIIQQEYRKPSDPSGVHRGGEDSYRHALADADHFASFSSASDSPRERQPTPASRTVTRAPLEDPFVIAPGSSARPNRNPQPAMPSAFDFARKGNAESGLRSMTFGHELLDSDPGAHLQVYIQREQDRIAAMSGGGTQPFREVDFGDESMSEFETSTRRPTTVRAPESASTEAANERQQLVNKLTELGNSVYRPSQRVAVPDVHALPATARGLFHPPGLTVANPTRSTLNATAPEYTHQSVLNKDSEGLELPKAVPKPTFNLKYSDPDGMRVPTTPQIINGTVDQTPTPQNFKGPFFTDHMPTTLNPAASGAPQMDHLAKLQNWYRDGQRPARQQEYSSRIIAAAEAEVKSRNTPIFGAIGDSRPVDPRRFETTPALVRLHENLAEYYEQSTKKPEERDYFTRAWKAPNQMTRASDRAPPQTHGNRQSFAAQNYTNPIHLNVGAVSWRDYGNSKPGWANTPYRN